MKAWDYGHSEVDILHQDEQSTSLRAARDAHRHIHHTVDSTVSFDDRRAPCSKIVWPLVRYDAQDFARWRPRATRNVNGSGKHYLT